MPFEGGCPSLSRLSLPRRLGTQTTSFGISSILFFTNITPSTTANVRNSGKRVHLSLRGGKYLEVESDTLDNDNSGQRQ